MPRSSLSWLRGISLVVATIIGTTETFLFPPCRTASKHRSAIQQDARNRRVIGIPSAASHLTLHRFESPSCPQHTKLEMYHSSRLQTGKTLAELPWIPSPLEGRQCSTGPRASGFHQSYGSRVREQGSLGSPSSSLRWLRV